MSMATISAIVEQPDATTPKGLRDRFFMILMYDLGARINEMINIKIRDIRVSKETVAELTGKGRKFRSVPLMERSVQHLKKYLELFHPEPRNNDAHLFYTISHGQKNPMSASCIRLFMSQYAESARKICAEVPENVCPHMWRHSRAMHLYQEGMDLTLVSQWLGHAQLQTTFMLTPTPNTSVKRSPLPLRRIIRCTRNSIRLVMFHLMRKRSSVLSGFADLILINSFYQQMKFSTRRLR